ncbi:ankyrin repeat domain-containing protein [Wolbachia endosymbiont of Liriomyza huidobrensis]|uniref:ankyrin repeat domain-containing protein n=1 Tax=Wolbachia endosymbiont of Liriomyza huidobrensis TaxID=2867522 RepID=UPI0036F1AD51
MLTLVYCGVFWRLCFVSRESMRELEEIIGEIGRGPNLNRESVIDEVKVVLQERDSSEYDKWQEDEFNVNHVFYGKTTLLHSASECCNEKIVEALIENGANVNAVDDCGQTPLYHAIRYENVEIMKVLIKNGASIDVYDEYGDTPLHIAVHEVLNDSEIAIIKTLIENGANVNAVDQVEYTPLHKAAFCGTVNAVQILIENGADVNAVSYFQDTPLHEAARWGKVDKARVLIESGANVNAVDWLNKTPLHEAVEKGATDVVRVLIENGANVNAVDWLNKTPLHEAIAESATGVVQMLIEGGANVNTKGSRGNAPLHDATRCGAADVVRMLVKSGANINLVNYYGELPLHLAAEHNHLEIVKYLVDSGADLSAIAEGKVPLDYAREGGHKEIVEYLEGKMAEVSQSQHESSQTSKKVCGESLDPEVLFGIDSMVMRGKSGVKKGESQKEKSRCLIQSSQEQQSLHLSGFLPPYLQIESVKRGLYLPSFKARNVKVDGKCVSITHGLSQTLFLQCKKSFLSNLKTSAEIYERIAQGKQVSKREEREVFAFSKLLDSFEQQVDYITDSLPSSLVHTQSYKTLGDLSNYIAGMKGDFAIHLVTDNHVIAIYRTGNSYAYFDCNVAFISGLKSVDQLIEVVEKGAGYKVEERGLLVEHFDVDKANTLLPDRDKQTLEKEIKTERQLLAEQDKELSLIKVNGQEISRVQLYDFGTKFNMEGGVPLLINADMKLSSEKFQDHLNKKEVSMTARDYLDNLENSKNVEEAVQATKFIPFIGSKHEIEEAEQRRKPKQPVLEWLVKGTINFILTIAYLANTGQSESQLPGKADDKPRTCLNDPIVDKQLKKSL